MGGFISCGRTQTFADGFEQTRELSWFRSSPDYSLDDTRRTPVPKAPKPGIKKPDEQEVSVPFSPREKGRDEGKPREEPKQEIPVSPLEEKEPEVKFTQQKPFTKLLDPSSLSPNENSPVGRVSYSTKPVAPKERQAKSLTYSFWGIALLALILGGVGLNYLFNKPPIATVTVSPSDTATPKTPTSTKVPSTPTSAPTETPIPTPTLGIGSIQVSEKDGMTLLYVPAGEFTMGSDNGSSDEQPAHQVYLNAFWIDRTEVTYAMYAKCVDAGKCEPGKQTDFGNSSRANHPVSYIDWNMAKIYCEWADRRLPTEAEWEKSARGTDGRTYPWGEGIDCDKANYNGGCVGDTSPVGSYELGKSPYKAYDMAGNVWEWVNDWYSETYYQSSPSANPLGPDTGQYHVERGGPWYNYSGNDVRSANRQWDTPNYPNLVGFRCARSP
jgi:formylglycine-generating enzyme required for sulfatase activity